MMEYGVKTAKMNEPNPVVGYGFKINRDEAAALTSCVATLKMKNYGGLEDFMSVLISNGYGYQVVPTKEDGIVEVKILEVSNADD